MRRGSDMTFEQRLFIRWKITCTAVEDGLVGMNLAEVFDHAVVSTKLSPAYPAFVMHLAGVDVHVRPQRFFGYEFLPTIRAGDSYFVVF